MSNKYIKLFDDEYVKLEDVGFNIEYINKQYILKVNYGDIDTEEYYSDVLEEIFAIIKNILE